VELRKGNDFRQSGHKVEFLINYMAWKIKMCPDSKQRGVLSEA